MNIDQLFQQAVALIGAGDVLALDRLLTDHPELARERLAAPGPLAPGKGRQRARRVLQGPLPVVVRVRGRARPRPLAQEYRGRDPRDPPGGPRSAGPARTAPLRTLPGL